MFGYSRVKNDVFIFREKLSEEVTPKKEVETKLLRLDEVTAQHWKELKRLRGSLGVLYRKWRYGSPETYILLAYVDKILAHIGWVVPANKIRDRYPFVIEKSYFIISCFTSPNFRGLGIYPSQLRKIVESDIPSKVYWGMAACDNIPSLKGICKAGGVKVAEAVQKKWFWGCISQVEYFQDRVTASNSKSKSISQKVSVFKDDYWIGKGSRKLLAYLGPHLEKNLEQQAVRRFIHGKGAWGAMWDYDHDYTEQGPWYRCICDNPDYDESAIKSKNTRHNLRRGLKRCVVRRLEYSWLADNAYEVYANATSRYKDFRIEPKKEFQQQMRSFSQVPCREAWGVFVGEKLVAYLTLFIHGETVFGDFAHFDPAYANAYPMYALYYTVAHHYLREKGLKEFSRGTRPLMHETNVDDFLLRLGYRKSYCRLGLYLVWPVRTVLCLGKAFEKTLKLMLPSRYYAILKGLLLAQDVAKATNRTVNLTYN